MNIYKTVPVFATALLLSACGSDGGDGATAAGGSTAKVSFSVSDAPVDSLWDVTIAFDQLELKHENGQSYFIDVDTDSDGNDYQQLNLLDYQGTDSKLIITSQELPVGTYKELIIHTKPGNMNWVDGEDGHYDLKIPSNKLRLGGFEVDAEAVQSFTIEFDLRKSLVLRGNESNNSGFNLKPHGVTIIDNQAAASLWGKVDVNLFSMGECLAESGNYVYLYEGHGHIDSMLSDNMDPNDEYFDSARPLPDNAVMPYASASVDVDGSYAFGYLPGGNYTVAFTCNAEDDDPVNYDENIIIENPQGQRKEITLDPMKETELNFVESDSLL